MNFFDLRLPTRIALAAASSALVLPINMLDSAVGEQTYVFVLSWWEILHGFAFGGLVMAPYIDTLDKRRIRVIALMIASVLIYKVAIESPDLLLSGILDNERTGFVTAGVVGAVLTAVATKFIGAFRVAPGYWVLTLFAGAIGGIVFSYTFDYCAWDSCDTVFDAVIYTSGWFVWQALVCAAMYVGRDRSHILKG